MSYPEYIAAQDVMKWRWANFKEDECRKPGWEQQTGVGLLHYNFLNKLQSMRTLLDIPLVITSAFRGPDYNRIVGGKPGSKHLLGRAVDIHVNGENAAKIMAYVLAGDSFNGLGIYQKGDWKSRYLHIDDAHDTDYTVVWSY